MYSFLHHCWFPRLHVHMYHRSNFPPNYSLFPFSARGTGKKTMILWHQTHLCSNELWCYKYLIVATWNELQPGKDDENRNAFSYAHILVISHSGQRHATANRMLLQFKGTSWIKICLGKHMINSTVVICLDVAKNFTPKLGSKETVDLKYLLCKPVWNGCNINCLACKF